MTVQPTKKLEALRDAAPVPDLVDASEVEKWRRVAAMWCKRALAAETSLAIMVEGIMK